MNQNGLPFAARGNQPAFARRASAGIFTRFASEEWWAL